MSLANTNSTQTYLGNGSTTIFPITFGFFTNNQVDVSLLDTGTQVETMATEGVEYTISGTNVIFGTAPASTIQVTVFRTTPKTQDIDYIETGSFKAEDHERGMDRMVMMIQELGRDVAEVLPVVGGGAFARLTAQGVLAAGTISVATNQRMLKNVQGDTGGSTADTTTPIAAGSIDGQELRLVGESDSNPLTIVDSGNVLLNGPIVFVKNTVLDVFWDLANTKWVESGRRD